MTPSRLAVLMVVNLSAAQVLGTTTTTRGNVVFDKIKEITISQASWKVTYVVDLGVYDSLFKDSYVHLSTAAEQVWDLIGKSKNESYFNFDNQYKMLARRLEQVNNTKNRLVETLEEYKSLRPRQERALLGFLGDAMSWLYGLTTDDDINDVRTAVNELSDNQQTIKHLVNQSLTIISSTHDRVKENREKINGIIAQVKAVRDQFDRALLGQNAVTKSIVNFLTRYTQLSMIADNLQELAVESVQHIDELRAQLDMVSMGKLTPSVIGPLHLREVLREIQKKLPNNLFLPVNLKKHIWEFYQQISCSAAFDKQHVLIVLDIPLASYTNNYDLIKVYNMPLPNTNMYKALEATGPYDPRQMVAKYELEADTFAIEQSRSRYVLLTKTEADRCLRSKTSFCSFSSPVYSVGSTARSCVISLFLNRDRRAMSVCRVKVLPKQVLPVAAGSWLVATVNQITFTVT